MTRLAHISLLAVALCTGCQTQRAKLRTVNLSDGVSHSEARIIGECYFTKNLAGGKVTDIEDGGDHWVVDGRLGGYLPKPLSVDIDKHSGRVTSQVGPSYDSPFDIYP